MFRQAIVAALALPLLYIPSRAQSAAEPLKLLKRVDPEYPKIAELVGAKGNVILGVVVATDGHVVGAKVLAGHPMLQNAAKNAVLQWIYAPPPSETTIEVTVSFGDVVPDSRPVNRQPVLVKRTDPVYPPEAKAAGITGMVMLRAKIDKEGRVTDVQALTGAPVLRQAAIDALTQWRYRPSVINGEPVESETQITLNFVGER
jgi:TonB family protein